MDRKSRDVASCILMLGLILAAATVLVSWFSCKATETPIPPVPSTTPSEGPIPLAPATKPSKEDVVSDKTDSHSGSKNIVIDHTNWDWYNAQTQQLFDRVATQKIYFSHASIGSNIMSGLAALHSYSPSKYPLSQTKAGASPPSQTTNGMIYEYPRGNPGWSAKVSSFETYVLNGWHDPKIDIAMNKFCYIDQDAGLTPYLDSMAALETKYPNTKFVYFTIPLSTENGSTAALRAQFNINLRKWIDTQNNKLFFDLADIESTNPSGARQTFTYKGMDYENLYKGYTSDGGHLNTEGSQRAATGLYSLIGQIINPAKALP
jgi:hypothetical protein